MIRNFKRVTISNICIMFSMKYQNHQLKQRQTWNHFYDLCFGIFKQHQNHSDELTKLVNNYKQFCHKTSWWKWSDVKDDKNHKNITQKLNHDLHKRKVNGITSDLKNVSTYKQLHELVKSASENTKREVIFTEGFLQHKFHHTFLSVILVFLLWVLISEFFTCFRPLSNICFVFYVLKLWYRNFDANFFCFLFWYL